MTCPLRCKRQCNPGPTNLAARGPGSVSPAPLPAAQAIRIVLDDGPGQPAHDDGDFVRDDQVPVAYWHGHLGQSILPPAKTPSRQAQARTAVQDALTNLARVSSKQPIGSSS